MPLYGQTLFIALFAITTPGYSQLKNPWLEKQKQEEAARKAEADKRAAQQREEARRNAEYLREQERIKSEEAKKIRLNNISIEQEKQKVLMEQERKKQEEESIKAAQENNTVYQVVETMPKFPGGDAALFNFLSTNIKYPSSAQNSGIQGRVICQFVVNRDGSIVDVEVARSVNSDLDREAVRVIKAMPKWIPGEHRGEKVRVKYTLPINFKLN